ncbi:hypothetical protein J6590_096413 [Homalodisca vitripennis]|nr:hypothetical protein J6590_096413 [Homalodisca vitripennis]
MFDGKVVQVVTDTSIIDIETVFVCIQQRNKTLILGAACIPPNMPIVDTNLPESDLLLLGDFNQPNTTWENLSMCTPAYSSQCIIDLSNLLHLHQCNQVRNYRGVILDLVPTTISDTTVFPAIETIVPIDVNHPLLAFCISLQKIDIPLNPTPCRSLKKCDLGAVWEWIQRQNHPTISSCNVI